MGFVPAPRTLKCAVRQTVNTVPVVNVLHVQWDAGYFDAVGTSLAGVAQDVFNNWRDHILLYQSSLTRLEGVDVKDMGNAEGEAATFTPGTVPTGGVATLAGAMFPPNVCYLYRLRTTVNARAGRGRMYVAGVHEGRADSAGLIPSATLGAQQTGANSFLAGVVDGGATPPAPNYGLAVASYTFAGADRLEARVSRVTSIEVDDFVASQRRRLRR